MHQNHTLADSFKIELVMTFPKVTQGSSSRKRGRKSLIEFDLRNLIIQKYSNEEFFI